MIDNLIDLEDQLRNTDYELHGGRQEENSQIWCSKESRSTNRINEYGFGKLSKPQRDLLKKVYRNEKQKIIIFNGIYFFLVTHALMEGHSLENGAEGCKIQKLGCGNNAVFNDDNNLIANNEEVFEPPQPVVIECPNKVRQKTGISVLALKGWIALIAMYFLISWFYSRADNQRKALAQQLNDVNTHQTAIDSALKSQSISLNQLENKLDEKPTKANVEETISEKTTAALKAHLEELKASLGNEIQKGMSLRPAQRRDESEISNFVRFVFEKLKAIEQKLPKHDDFGNNVGGDDE